MSVFEPVDPNREAPELEAKILKYWKENEIFEQSLELRQDNPRWVFYEGPPTANGKPHPGHVLTRVVKDLFPRYKTMCGYFVPRKAGWDTHGLPVEIEVEKQLGLDGKKEIEAYGVQAFVKKCIDSVFKYTTEWEEMTQKIGFWIDLSEAYVTYHQTFVESVWWSLQQLHRKGLLYRGHKILPWCPRCGTALSSHEVGQGYKDVEDPSAYVMFRCADDPATGFLAWTTTPWTLPSNSGLAVNPNTRYSHVKLGDQVLIMASALVEAVMGKLPHEVVKRENGSELVGRRYEPLFQWWRSTKEERSKAWRVAAADFVTLETGTGIVHIAPAFGSDDYNLGQKEGLPVIRLVGPDGCFIDGCEEYTGRYFKDADSRILKDLKDRGLLLRRENYRHSYPHCWRCKAPLINYAREGWFIRTTEAIEKIKANNKTVSWYPDHIGTGRFGNFLESNIDWALSRERFWGTPLPIWKSEDGSYEEAIGSFKELAEKDGVAGLDAFDKARAADPTLNEHLRVHKPWIDEITYKNPKGSGRMRRVPEVIDCWYDSGAMPFAQWGYPHLEGSLEDFSENFPADFISEAIDQTRGWFYSLIAESSLLFEGASMPHPYKNCLVLGHVCDEKGTKMSKSLGNYLDPMEILNNEGADALRWFFYSSTNPWTSARFSRAAVRECQKEFLIKLRNVYSFFVINANPDGFDPNSGTITADEACMQDFSQYLRGGRLLDERCELDRWVLSELHQNVETIRKSLDSYDIFAAAKSINDLVEGLSNWWLQRNRDRFWRKWQSDDYFHPLDQDKLDAYWTLYECLVTTARLIAPFVPFTAEDMWQNLVVKPLGEHVPESVHLTDYPNADPRALDPQLASEVALLREVVALGRNVRASTKLKVRLPLSKMIVVLAKAEDFEILQKHEEVLKDALNIKSLQYARVAEDYVSYNLKPNFKAIGSKYRDKVPAIKQALANANALHLQHKLSEDGSCFIQIDGERIELTRDEVQIEIEAKPGYAAASGKQAVAILDTRITQALLDEGFARDMVFQINKLRKDLNLKYEQRIKLTLSGSPRMETIAHQFGEYLCNETLCTELACGTLPEDWRTFPLEVEGENGLLALLEVDDR